jgi:hypothetical protein
MSGFARGVLTCFALLVCIAPTPAAGAKIAKATDPNEDFSYYSRLFLSCMDTCNIEGCAHVTHKGAPFTTGGCVPACARDGSMLGPGEFPPEFTLAMRLTGWDCASDCKYRCMRTVVRVRAAEGLNTAKYYGKWSFERVLGVQEIVSCVASLANAAVHVWFLPELWRASAGRRIEDARGAASVFPPRLSASLWFANGVVQTHGWLWSAVFHARDTPWTHALDYGAANAIFFFAAFAAVVRTRAIAEPRRLAGALACFAFCFLAHLWYVNRRQEDGTKYHFQHNMAVMVCVAVFHWCVMLRWAFFGKREGKRPGRNYLAACCLAWNACALAEVLDFPPVYGLLDAHALWHCGTPATVWLWYQFARRDAGLSQDSPRDAEKKSR